MTISNNKDKIYRYQNHDSSARSPNGTKLQFIKKKTLIFFQIEVPAYIVLVYKKNQWHFKGNQKLNIYKIVYRYIDAQLLTLNFAKFPNQPECKYHC